MFGFVFTFTNHSPIRKASKYPHMGMKFRRSSEVQEKVTWLCVLTEVMAKMRLEPVAYWPINQSA